MCPCASERVSSRSFCVWLHSGQLWTPVKMVVCPQIVFLLPVIQAMHPPDTWEAVLHLPAVLLQRTVITEDTLTGHTVSTPPSSLTTPITGSKFLQHVPVLSCRANLCRESGRTRTHEAAAAAWRIHWAATLQSFLLTHPNQQGRDTTTQVAHTAEVCPPPPTSKVI